jgi:hypothetical protein
MSEGTRRERKVDERDFDSVPGTFERGRRTTSKAKREGCSAAKRTSIGPDIEARAFVSPV